MRKSELYARYIFFNKDIEEITPQEFASYFIPENKDKVIYDTDGSSECYTVRTDGCDYIRVGSHWNVGWEGDVDMDSFFCKIQTMSQAEREELRELFTSNSF